MKHKELIQKLSRLQSRAYTFRPQSDAQSRGIADLQFDIERLIADLTIKEEANLKAKDLIRGTEKVIKTNKTAVSVAEEELEQISEKAEENIKKLNRMI